MHEKWNYGIMAIIIWFNLTDNKLFKDDSFLKQLGWVVTPSLTTSKKWRFIPRDREDEWHLRLGKINERL